LHRFKHKHIKLKGWDNLKDLDTFIIIEGDCPPFPSCHAFPSYMSPSFKLNKDEYILNIESKVSEYNIFFTSLNSPYTCHHLYLDKILCPSTP